MNYALLKYELELKKVKPNDLCIKLNLSRSALYRKMTGKSDFTRTEIQVIINELELDKDKTESIFFSNKVS